MGHTHAPTAPGPYGYVIRHHRAWRYWSFCLATERRTWCTTSGVWSSPPLPPPARPTPSSCTMHEIGHDGTRRARSASSPWKIDPARCSPSTRTYNLHSELDESSRTRSTSCPAPKAAASTPGAREAESWPRFSRSTRPRWAGCWSAPVRGRRERVHERGAVDRRGFGAGASGCCICR